MTWDMRLETATQWKILEYKERNYLEPGVQDAGRVLEGVEAEHDLCLVGHGAVQSGPQVLQGPSQPPVLILHCRVSC